MDAANHFLEYLTPMREFGDPELQFEISLLEIELLIKKQEYPTASKLVSKQIVEVEPKNHSKGAGKQLSTTPSLHATANTFSSPSCCHVRT